MLQICTGEAVFGDFPDAAVFHVAAEHSSQYSADLGLALAAFSLNDHHALPLVAGDQAVADKLLQSNNVLRVQQPIQEGNPQCRLRRIRLISDR